MQCSFLHGGSEDQDHASVKFKKMDPPCKGKFKMYIIYIYIFLPKGTDCL